MYTYLYCLLAATLAARTRHGLLNMSLEEAIRWLLLRGYSPFIDETCPLDGWEGLMSPIPIGEEFPMVALQEVVALLIMERPDAEPAVLHGESVISMPGHVYSTPCAGQINITPQGAVMFVRKELNSSGVTEEQEVLIVGNNADLVSGSHHTISLQGDELKLLQVGRVVWACAHLDGERLSTQFEVGRKDIVRPYLGKCGEILVDRQVRPGAYVTHRVYLK